MKAVIVYESLRGSTAAVAQAIAEADLIVAGAPVHSPSLPTGPTGEWARAGSLGPGDVPPDLSHPKMRSWLGELPKGGGCTAAFDTRVLAWYGGGAPSKIAKTLRQAGYRPIARPRGFYVTGHPVNPTTSGALRKGGAARARLWGAGPAKAMKK